jgi:splicing factor 3B subunit 2
MKELRESNDEALVAEYADVLKKFLGTDSLEQPETKVQESTFRNDLEDDENLYDGSETNIVALSRKARKKLMQVSIIDLKKATDHPENVEAIDVTSTDPFLLVHFKSSRNAVPVPRHWSNKRKYLQGKRGFEKPPFQLPDFILNTGITKLREADISSKADASLKSKVRDKFKPSVGKIDIDYQTLHDAFFKYQKKPLLSSFGHLYYEGLENELLNAKSYSFKPGTLSEKLRAALHMSNDATCPPPWLVSMQRYGPPPSYPNLLVPGVNAKLPKGAEYGYQPGGWGKPPVNEYGQPIYGDVFGFSELSEEEEARIKKLKKRLWGEVQESSSEWAGGRSEGGQSRQQQVDGLFKFFPPGAPSTGDAEKLEEGEEAAKSHDKPEAEVKKEVSQLEISSEFEIRKGSSSSSISNVEKEAYQVISTRTTELQGGILGSTHVYNLDAIVSTENSSKVAENQGIQVAIAPEDIDNLDEEAIKAKYEVEVSATKVAKEDFSDLHSEQEKKKKRKAEGGDGGTKKKSKSDFKFC